MSEARLLRVVPVTGSSLSRAGPLRAGAIVPVAAQQKPKLLDQVRDAIRTRHYSYRTEEAYVHWIKRYVLFHRKRHPAEMGARGGVGVPVVVGNRRPRERLHSEPGAGRAPVSVS